MFVDYLWVEMLPPLPLKSYEVAPRSDSEESGSDFEEEVCDILFQLVISKRGIILQQKAQGIFITYILC